MLTKKLILPLLLALTINVYGQDSLLLRSYQFVKQADPWLVSNNAAALTRYASRNIAEAELALNYEDGKLTDYYGAPRVLQANAAVESFYRLNTRTVVFGCISYDNWTGRDMTGSAFTMLPSASLFADRYPFNIVEDSLTNSGRKHRDTYRLTGAVGFDLYQGIAAGLRLDYTAANYAKYKDLRHKNKLMDLALTASVYAPVLPWLTLGANYTYHRNTESLSFNTYGKSDKVYKSLIDYGAFTGLVEQLGNVGYTDKTREMPLFEDSHGAGLQVGLQPLPGLTALASMSFSRGQGYYGRRSPYTIAYTQHDRHTNEASLAIVYQPLQGSSSYHLNLSYQNEKLANRAETHRELTSATAATYYEYYDPVETGDKQWNEWTLSARTNLGIQGELPTWELTAAYRWAERKQVAFLYPFYRHQQLSVNVLSASATRHIVGKHQDIWSFTLTAGYQKGSGSPFEDFTFATPSSKQDTPATMDAFLYREHYYLTAGQLHIGGEVRYAFIFPATQLKTHVAAGLNYRRANDSCDYTDGNNRVQARVALGCTF